MSKTSTMFLNYLTCLDHAYIDPRGRVIGGSFHPIIEVTGAVSEKEQVVVDFSAVKKQIKDIIDSKESGFDHKLWIIEGLSKCEYSLSNNEYGSFYKIQTPACHLIVPTSAVKIIHCGEYPTYLKSSQDAIQFQLEGALALLHPMTNISVKVELTEEIFNRSPEAIRFRYSHGLKNSTSWGCQNNSHGHLSWAEIKRNANYSPHCSICRTASAEIFRNLSALDESILIFRDNIVEETLDYVQISYSTERGTFSARYMKALNNIIIMDKETTIENIVDWFVDSNYQTLQVACIASIYISEGLSKGAVRHIPALTMETSA